MAIDISAYITANFPRTEAELQADAAIDYDALKTTAIARAKRDAYGTRMVPSESDIPDIVGEWIADKATLYLIPIGKEHYSLDRYRQKSNQQGEQIARYDLLQMLAGLQDELERACAESWPEVEALIGKAAAPTEVPQVSYAGTMINPVDRALARGLPW